MSVMTLFHVLLLPGPLLLAQVVLAAPALVPEGPAPRAGWDEMRRLFDYQPVPLETSAKVVERGEGVEVSEVSYASPKGGRVTGYLVTPSGPGPFAAIVFGHWGYGNATEFLPEAGMYARAGAVCLLPDYPWARRAPHRSAQAPGLDDPARDRDLFVQAVVDLRRGIDLLASRPDVDAGRIGYVGHSYGAQWGAILSAVDDRVRTAVLVGGVGALADLFVESDDPDMVALRAQEPKEKMDRYLEVHAALDGIRYVPHAAPTPLLFQFGRHERTFGMASMERYHKAASEPKRVLWYDTGHELNDLAALLDRGEWLRSHVGIGSIAEEVRRRAAAPGR